MGSCKLLVAEELLTVDGCWQSFLLGCGPLYINHIPVDGPTPMHILVTLTGLSGMKFLLIVHKFWSEPRWGGSSKSGRGGSGDSI